MLDPRTRGALLEALRPPPGYVVESAVATTYSLDLVALLTAPLAFSLFDRLAAREGNKPERLDSFALLHAVRRHAERLVVFCESGCIARPSSYRQLLAYLEDSVVQVRAPSENGVFHPKIWVTRLTSATEPVRYRVLCLSRNLTFDRSWDTMLALDGELMDRTRSIGESKPLAELVEALPSLALSPVRDAQRDIVGRMAEELRRVRFDVPEPFEALRFWPLGHVPRSPDPFAQIRRQRLLVVSPFLAVERLKGLAEEGEGHVLASRLEELEKMPKAALAGYASVHVLTDEAHDLDETPSDEVEAGPVPSARGLHAKLYVGDDGWNAHVWTGSANATNAAFGANVELLVQLTGKKSKVGVDAFLDAKAGLSSLLVPFKPSAQPVVPTELEEALEEAVRVANRAISRAAWVAHISPDGGDTYAVTLKLETGALRFAEGTTVRAWPIALPPDRGLQLDETCIARFSECSMQALTAFFAFDVTVRGGSRVEHSVFVVRVRLVNPPEDRIARVLHGLLDDPAKVLRFLRLLLAQDPSQILDELDDDLEADGQGPATKRGTASANGDVAPLFESLVRTLARDPQRLQEVQRFVQELQGTAAGKSTLPADFDDVWTPLWATYQSMHVHGGAK